MDLTGKKTAVKEIQEGFPIIEFSELRSENFACRKNFFDGISRQRARLKGAALWNPAAGIPPPLKRRAKFFLRFAPSSFSLDSLL